MMPNQFAIVQQVEEFIQVDRSIIISQCSNCTMVFPWLAYSIMHDGLKFWKVCAWWMPRVLKNQEKNKPNGFVLATSLTAFR
jgi:hypothetical protein